MGQPGGQRNYTWINLFVFFVVRAEELLMGR